MKKFLSILLAVMMVLSTASFAAPSAFTAIDSAKVEADVVAEEVVADLAAEVNKASYGTLIYKVDFENDNFDVNHFSTAYSQLKNGTTASYINSAFDTSNVTTYTNAAGDGFSNAQLVTEGGNTYITGDVASGYDGFFRMTKYNMAWPEGYYTFTVDVKAPAGQASGFAQQCNDTAVALTTVSGFDTANGDWQTVVNRTTDVVNGASIYGYFVTPANATNGTVSYDNWEVYYRPATVTLTIDGNDYEVSTDAPVTVASLASKVVAPIGYVLSGFSLTEGGDLLEGAQYFFEDTVLYPSFKVDDTIDARYGKKIVSFKFDDESMFPDDLCNDTYYQYAVNVAADYYDASHNLAVLQYYIPFTGIPSFENGYSQSSMSGWGSINLVTHTGETYKEGIYTIAFDMAANIDVDRFAISQSSSAFTTLDDYTHTDGNTFDHVVLEVNKDYLSGKNNLQVQISTALDSLKVDNFEVFYKPNTVDVVLVCGDEEYVAEDVVTSGVSVNDLLAAAGVDVPYGMKAVLCATEDGEPVGDTVKPVVNNTTYFVFFETDESFSTYGQPLFVIDFENAAAQNWWGHSSGDNSATTHGAQVWEVATKYDPIFQGMNYRVRFLINESTHNDQVTKEENGNHFTEGTAVSMWPQLSLSNWASMTYKPGVYTFTVDTRPASAPSDFRLHDPWTRLDTVGAPAAGKWSTIVAQQTLTDDAPAMPKGEPIINYSFDAAGATVAFDNAILYYKPLTADVTLSYKGEEYVVENVSTSGVSADSIVAASGIEIPYGKKAVLSATEGGASVGNAINLISDTKFYVSFVDDDALSEYGKRLFLIDFEQFEVDHAFISANTVRGLASDYVAEVADVGITLYVDTTAGKEGGTVLLEDENKYVGSLVGRGWGQFAIKSLKDKFGKDGYYTIVADAYATTARTMGMANNTEGVQATVIDPWCGEANKWDTIVAEYSAPQNEMITWFTDGDAEHPIRFDDIALYYRPASVNLTVVDLDGNEIVYEDTDSVVDTDKLLADIPAPFGYRIGLATEADGEPLTGEINLVSDAKLYAVLVEDDRFDLNYGKAMAIVDFERESMQGWWGCSQEVNNSVDGNGAYISQIASYYDERFENQNFRLRFVINENPRVDQQIVVDENGNHYTTGTNTTKWPQVVNTNFGNVPGEAGVYTYMFDVKIEETTETSISMGNGTLPNVVSVDPFCAQVGVWDTVIVQTTLAEDGLFPKGTWSNFGFAANETTTLSYDNAKIYYKPFYADIEVRANGEVVKTIPGVSTETGVTVDRILEGVKVKGYTITGVRFGDKTYVAGETIVAPCDAHVDLALEVAAIDPATPEVLDDDKSVRAGDISGLRFKAALSKAEMEDITAFGWIVTREDLLIEAGISANNFEKDSNVKKSLGYNYGSGTDVAKIFEQDDNTAWFTAVLYFQKTEADGLPSAEKLCGKLVARPFAVVDGEYLYGDATTPASIFDVALDYYYENTDDHGNYFEVNETSDYVDAVLAKCDEDADDIPDIWQ